MPINPVSALPSIGANAGAGFVLPDPGLVGNAPDGMSCMHACMQMIMQTKKNGRVYSFSEIDQILRRKPGLYSWIYGIAESLSREGFTIKSIGSFSTARFIREGEAYLLDYLGAEAGHDQIMHSDIPIIIEDATKFLASNTVAVEERVPNLDDIRSHIHHGWYVMPLINPYVLRSELGYAGYFVLIYGYDAEGVIFHDPGLPPLASRKISWELFNKAWSSPSETTRSIDCFKPNN